MKYALQTTDKLAFSVLNKHLINYKTMCYTSIFIDAENTKQ